MPIERGVRRYLSGAAADVERPFPNSAGGLLQRECDARFAGNFVLGSCAGTYPFAGLQEFGLRARRERRGRLHDTLANFDPLHRAQLARGAARAARRFWVRARCGRRCGLAAASAANEKRSAEERDDQTCGQLSH